MFSTLNTTWNQTILNKIRENFNALQILEDLSYIEKNLNNISDIKIKLFDISNNVYSLFSDIFPLIGFGYRYGIEIRAVSPAYKNIYDVLNETACLYSNFNEMKSVLSNKTYNLIAKTTIQKINQEGNYLEKGIKWGQFNDLMMKIIKNYSKEPEKNEVKPKEGMNFLKKNQINF